MQTPSHRTSTHVPTWYASPWWLIAPALVLVALVSSLGAALAWAARADPHRGVDPAAGVPRK